MGDRVGQGARKPGAGAYAIGLPVNLPGVHIGPSTYGHGRPALVGGQDIELESEEFNRAFRAWLTNVAA